MYVLDGKKLSFVIVGVFLSIFGLISATDLQGDASAVPTVSLPVSGKTIVVDAGHGKPDERCRVELRHNRSGDKFENFTEIAGIARAERLYGHTYSL